MIDWDRINELRRDFGEEDFAEIAEAFLSEVEAKLSSLDPTSRSLADDFHFLKGSAANLGFKALQAACSPAELQPDPDKISEIKALFQASKEQFSASVGGPAAA